LPSDTKSIVQAHTVAGLKNKQRRLVKTDKTEQHRLIKTDKTERFTMALEAEPKG